MSGMTLEEAREMLEVVVGPEDLVSKVPEFNFGAIAQLLSANGLSSLPPLPSKEKCLSAKEQKKGLVFRVSRDGAGQPVHLIYLKEKFSGLIYSSWYLKRPEPFTQETPAAGWALVDLDPVPDSTEKTYDEQVSFAESQGARVKNVISDAYDLLVVYKVTGKFFRRGAINGRTTSPADHSIIKISHFDKNGMCISTSWGPSVKNAEIGAAAELILS